MWTPREFHLTLKPHSTRTCTQVYVYLHTKQTTHPHFSVFQSSVQFCFVFSSHLTPLLQCFFFKPYCFHPIFQAIHGHSISICFRSHAAKQDRCLPLQQPSRDVAAAHCGGGPGGPSGSVWGHKAMGLLVPPTIRNPDC